MSVFIVLVGFCQNGECTDSKRVTACVHFIYTEIKKNEKTYLHDLFCVFFIYN